MSFFLRTSLLLAVAGLCVSCSTSDSAQTPEAASSSSASSVPPAAAPAPVTASSEHHAEHAIHNVHAFDPNLISGGVPEGDAGFDELKAMGVKTVISVDGAAPDVERATARGMRYVHIPITYADVTDDQRLEIARAVRDLPGPIFIHCHHGKHRSPAATAAVAVTLGRASPDEATLFMKKCGTAPNYAGLYACVAATVPASASLLDSAPADFPPVRTPDGIVAAMVDIDLAFEHLGEVRAAGWKAPPDHPDLVPAAEAGRLVDLLRVSGEDPRVKVHGEGYVNQHTEAIQLATAFEEAIVANKPAEELEKHFKLVQASCKECHASYRDKR